MVSISSGAVAIPAETISAVIQDRLAEKLGIAYDSGLDYTDRTTARNATLILDIRLPRVILAALVGVALALAVPVTLLGCVSPFAVRLAVTDVAQAGQVAGLCLRTERQHEPQATDSEKRPKCREGHGIIDPYFRGMEM